MEKSYNKSSDKISWRFFTGFHFNDDISSKYSFYLSGKNGKMDYLYDNIYFARNSSDQNYLLSRQNDDSYGGFKVQDTNLRSNNWMISNNFKIDIPKLPLGIFADFGMFQSTSQEIKLFGNTIQEYLLRIILNDEIIGIYLPLLYSNNIKASLNELKILQRINFIFNLQ